MIAKLVRNPKKSATKAQRISSLLAYIANPATTDEREKCTAYLTRGFLAATNAGQAIEMTALAEAAPRSADPIAHHVFSWGPDERPTHEQLDELLDIFVDELDRCDRPKGLRPDHTFADHQVALAMHEDTDNCHAHVVISRVDPATERAIKVPFPVEVGQRVAARVEHAQGWQPENGKRWRVTDAGDVVRTARGARNAPKRPTQRDLRTERQTGQPSATRIAIDRALPGIARAKTWERLHSYLDHHGMTYVRSGPGAVVMIGDVPVKTSRIDTAAGLEALVKRLGPFEPPARRKPHPLTKQELAELVAGASSWDQLHTDLAAQNCTYTRKGSGAIVRGPRGEWKASDLARGASRKRLEARLGPYTEAPADPPPGRDERRLIRTTPDEVARRITMADNWHHLHDELRAVGARYRTKGSGAVVWLGDREMKASEVSRHATLARLERRLGPYEPAHTYATESLNAASFNDRYYYDEYRPTVLAKRDAAADDEKQTHQKNLAQIDEGEQAELRDGAAYFPPPANRDEDEPANRDKDEDEPAKDDADPTADARVRAAQEKVLHDAVRLAIERKARRARAKENRRYATALAALARQFAYATSKFGWVVDRLQPANGWDSTERDATIRPCRQPSADTAVEQRIDDVTALRVGERVEYRDRNDDLACADLGPEIIVRHPSARERQLAGLRLAATKWPGAPVEVVNLPSREEALRYEARLKPRVIEDMHEEIRQLEKIAQRVARKAEQIVPVTPTHSRPTSRPDMGRDR